MLRSMPSRRWIDWDIIARMGLGAILVAAPLFTWFALGFITRGLWIGGALGAVIFCWGLFSIGDIKSDYE